MVVAKEGVMVVAKEEGMREVEREEEGKVEAEWVGEERVGEERVEATEEAWVATRVGAMAVVEMAVVAREGEEM